MLLSYSARSGDRMLQQTINYQKVSLTQAYTVSQMGGGGEGEKEED